MICILLILLIPSVYFSARFFLLYKNIKISTRELKEICENIELNRRLTYFSYDKNFENLIMVMNEYLEEAQRNKIRYIRRESKIREEIENVSHDLRTPLTSILGYLELLNDVNISSEEKDEYLSIIKRRSNGLYKLVEVFYDLSRLEANEYKFNMQKIDINKEIREHILLFYNDFENKNINVEINLLNEEVFVEADKTALERVFTNLFQNTIKYSRGEFKISLEKTKHNVKIILINSIDELTEREVENLFDRFYMKDKTRSTSSSGLGLTITKLLIEKMNGEIRAEIINGVLIFIIDYPILIV